MSVILHPDLGLFPIGTTVKAYLRSELGTMPGSFPSGPPSGTETDSAAVASDGTLTFTALTAGESYFGYALVSSQHRYFGFTVDAAAPAGGSTAPTDILVIGTDVPLLNGWTVPDPVGDLEPVARIYKQGGRVYFYGSVIAPGGTTSGPFQIPATHAPHDFGDSNDAGFAVSKDWASAAYLDVSVANMDGTHDMHVNPTPGIGTYISLDGVSWPAAS